MKHVPVLLEEVMTQLRPQKNESFIDGTVGLGGHAKELVARILPHGRLLAFDRDADNLAIAQKELAAYHKNVTFIHDSFANAKKHAYDHGFYQVNGILLDLGFSSAHVESADRGFSFLADGPLDMRFDRRQELTAEMIVNSAPQTELATIFRTYGEERYAQQLADLIVAERKHQRITTTRELARIIENKIKRRGKMHPATRVFQALRIAVNDELGELKRALPDLVDLLAPNGRMAVISFHSLEDRIVKRFFKERDGDTITILNKRVIQPSKTEIKINPRARSAKLRIIERR